MSVKRIVQGGVSIGLGRRMRPGGIGSRGRICVGFVGSVGWCPVWLGRGSGWWVLASRCVSKPLWVSHSLADWLTG